MGCGPIRVERRLHTPTVDVVELFSVVAMPYLATHARAPLHAPDLGGRTRGELDVITAATAAVGVVVYVYRRVAMLCTYCAIAGA